jgi:hypothetical protein
MNEDSFYSVPHDAEDHQHEPLSGRGEKVFAGAVNLALTESAGGM